MKPGGVGGIPGEVADQLLEAGLRIVSEKAFGFMEAHVWEGETPGDWVIRGT